MGKIGKIIGAVVAGTAAVAGGIAAGKKIADSKKEKRTIIIESYNEGINRNYVAIPHEKTNISKVEEKKEDNIVQCLHCNNFINKAAKFCKYCGNSTAKKNNYCFSCGAKLTEDAAFCIECGAKVK